MSRKHKVQLAVLLAVSWAAGDIGLAQTVEANAPAPEKADAYASGRAGSIDGAKKDFEAVKSLRDFGADPKGEMPRVSVPTMPTGASPSFPLPAAKKPDAEKPTSNWLVDAMEKRAPARNLRESDGRLFEKDREEQRESRDERLRSGAERDPKDHGGLANPFARYLGEWITPQDYALLKPALEPSLSATAFRTMTPSASTPGEVVSVGQETGVSPLTGLAPPAPRLNAAGAVRENPYLEIVGSAGPMPSHSPFPPKPNVATAVSAPLGGSIPPSQTLPAAPPSKIPEFARPNPDEKYFKQLKRF